MTSQSKHKGMRSMTQSPIVESVTTYSLGTDTWLPVVDHTTPDISVYNFVLNAPVVGVVVSSSLPLPYIKSQSSPPVDRNDAALAWVGANWEKLAKEYPNQWVVIDNGRVVAHSTTPDELQEQIAQLGIESPFITKVGQGPIVWTTAYAHR
jgi:Family of unknown function (DUF5678)